MKWLGAAAGGLLGLVLSSLLGNHFLTVRLRPYLRRVLEERKGELAKL